MNRVRFYHPVILLCVSECVCVSKVSLQSRDRIGTGGPVVDCSRLFDNDLPDG